MLNHTYPVPPLEVTLEDAYARCLDPLNRVYWTDEAAQDWPEDLTCSRDLGDWISEVNALRDLVNELTESLHYVQDSWSETIEHFVQNDPMGFEHTEAWDKIKALLVRMDGADVD